MNEANLKEVRLFALNAGRRFGEQVAAELGVPLSDHEEREFEDGEHKARPLENVRGRDVFVMQSLHGDERQSVNDKLIRLLFFIGALKDASAGQVTALVPYLCYARKDRKTKSRDPVTIRYVAGLFEAVGVDRLVVLDVHNLAAFQNAFRCPTEHLEAKKLFVDYFAAVVQAGPVAVVSPDVGGVKRAERFREALSKRLGRPVANAFMEKQRSAGVVSGEVLVGEVEDKAVILLDDMIASGTTMVRAAKACRERGAKAIYAAASHGVFTGEADRALADPLLEKVVVTNTIPPFRLTAEAVLNNLAVVNVAQLFAEAIKRIHSGGSIVALLED